MRAHVERGFPLILASLLAVVLGGAPGRAEVNLGDIVGGGDGKGTAPPENVGISADDGTFQQVNINNTIPNTGDNPHKVRDTVLADGSTGSPLIDSGFLFHV